MNKLKEFIAYIADYRKPVASPAESCFRNTRVYDADEVEEKIIILQAKIDRLTKGFQKRVDLAYDEGLQDATDSMQAEIDELKKNQAALITAVEHLRDRYMESEYSGMWLYEVVKIDPVVDNATTLTSKYWSNRNK